jgi:replicative DNA helicase
VDCRTVPNNIEAEACVLGSMILDAKCIGSVTDILNGPDFHRPAHETIFGTLTAMSGNPIDLVILRDQMIQDSTLDMVGGVEYLVQLAESIPSSANVEHYARIVRDRSVARALINQSVTLIDNLYSGEDVAGSAEECLRGIYDESHRLSDSNILREHNISEAAQMAISEIEARVLNPGLAGISTGIEALDEVTHGWRPGHLIIIGADTGGGKSTLALCQAATAASRGSHGIYISAEMTAVELTQRVLQAKAGVWGNRLLTGDMNSDQLNSLRMAAQNVAQDRLWMIPKACTLAEIRMAIADRRAIWGKCDFVVVDYIQIMKLDGKDGRREAVAEYIYGLKAIANEYQVPVIALSQLNRAGNQTDTPPEKSAFIESSSIEQAANSAILLWRNPQEGMQESLCPGARSKYVNIHVKVAKQRDGTTTDWAIYDQDGKEPGRVLKWYPALTDITG